MLVIQRKWMTNEEFADTLSLCQFIPGPNIANLAVVFGARARGSLGALAALTGMILPAFIIVVTLGTLYTSVATNGVVRGLLAGLAASAAGLLIAMVTQFCVVLVKSYAREALPFAIVSFVAVGFVHVPLPIVLVVLAPISIAIVWWRTK